MPSTPRKAKRKVIAIDCEIMLGAFSNERIVSFQLADGETVTAFVDRRDVRYKGELKEGETIKGKLFVAVVGVAGNKVLIDLPQATIARGTRLYVPKPTLREVFV